MIDYMNPDYTDVFIKRQQRLQELRGNPKLLQAMKIYYKDNPWDFISDWGFTFDPRQIEKGLLPNIPFILWDKQVEFLRWLDQQWKAGEYGIVEKSRDCGVTWLAVAFCVTNWLFTPGFSAGFGSAKEDKVDRKGDPDCIFEKIRFFLKNIPIEFYPEGYIERVHSGFMKLVNPENDATITGEAGDQMGRGGRKAQPLNTPILTPSGWVNMGDLSIGDFVIGDNGKPTKIIGIQDHGVKEVYKVNFGDGTSTRCCGDHLWTVTTRPIRKANGRSSDEKRRMPYSVTLPISEMADNVLVNRTDDQKEYQYQIPITQPVEFTKSELPIDPYLLGALLGDGSLANINKTSITITSIDPEIVQEVKNRVPDGISVNSDGKIGYRLAKCIGSGRRNKLKVMLEDMGLAGHKSETKFIPQQYLVSSISARLEMLQGLMDTDGWVGKRKGAGRVCFASASIQLASDVAYLVRSLGGVASMSVKKTTHLDSHCVFIAMPDGINPFKLPRKAERVGTREKYRPRRSIISIEPDGEENVRCITVQNSNGLYLCNDFIVTHNSLYLVDESAFVEHQQMVDNALSQATNCHIDISTYNGNGNNFYRKAMRFHGTRRKFIFDWRDDPRKDDVWYAKLKDEKDKVTIAQEVDRDPNASAEDVFIPSIWVQAAIDLHKLIKVPTSGIRVTAFDPADVGDAKAIVCRYGYVITMAELKTDGDITQAIPWAYEKSFYHNSDILAYDADGMGAPIMKLTFGSYAAGRLAVVPFYGSGEVKDKKRRYGEVPGMPDRELKTNQDTFFNYRAQAATWMRDRFEAAYNVRQQIESGGVALAVDVDTIISIDSTCVNHFELVAELSRPKRIYTNNGKIKVESKKEMKARGVESPNLFDACMMAIAAKIPDIRNNRNIRTRSIGVRDRGLGL